MPTSAHLNGQPHEGIALSGSSTLTHYVKTEHRWYSGQTGWSLCGTRVTVLESVASTAAGVRVKFGTCKRCAKHYDQTVRAVG